MTPVGRVVLVDKPVGPTSFDMVRAVRRILGGRVGHAGTLDPFASGLLVMLAGAATRLSDLLMHSAKEYDLVVQFGAVSTTADPTGEVESTGRRVRAGQVLQALDGQRGRIRQRVPLTSAVKVDGERLYKKAHRGETAETPEREVVIYGAQMIEFDDDAQTARLLVLSGSGVYMRTLAEDLGRATGAGAYALALRRTRVGRFRVADAIQAGELSEERCGAGARGVFGLDEALGWLPRWEVDQEQARLAANGNLLRVRHAGRFRVHGPDGLLGVYQQDGEVARPLFVVPRTA